MTAIAVIGPVERFRDLARQRVLATDHVLEIGSSSGETTAILAERARSVVALDVSEELTERTRIAHRDHDHVAVHRADARDLEHLRKIAGRPDVVFLDLGGDARADLCLWLTRQCLTYFKPRLIVARNKHLAEVVQLVEEAEPGPAHKKERTLPGYEHLDALLALSHTSSAQSRSFAARRLRKIPHPQAEARIAELKRDPNGNVQRAAQAEMEAGEGAPPPTSDRGSPSDG